HGPRRRRAPVRGGGRRQADHPPDADDGPLLDHPGLCRGVQLLPHPRGACGGAVRRPDPRDPHEGRRVRLRRRPGGHDHRRRPGAARRDEGGRLMATWDVESAATELLAREDERREGGKITDEWPELDVATGYEVQDLTLRRRLDRGEQLVGVKLGLTSRAKQERMGVDTPFVAWLTDAMVLPAGDPVPQDRLIP